MTNIYISKRPCPRDLGYWYCSKCLTKHEIEQSLVDFSLPITGCGRISSEWVCGETHLGFEWCKECRTARRTMSHAGEFEVIGTISEGVLKR